jgi:hypothetical protein
MPGMLGVRRFKVNGPHHDVNLLENESEDTSVSSALAAFFGMTVTLRRARSRTTIWNSVSSQGKW